MCGCVYNYIHLPRNEAKVTNICRCCPDSDSFTTQRSSYASFVTCINLSTTTHGAVHYKNAAGSEAIKSNEHVHTAETSYPRLRTQYKYCNYDVTEAVLGASALNSRSSRPGPTAQELVQGASTISHQGVAVASLERICNTPTAIAFSRLHINWKPPTIRK